jgi:hypothetical protein
MEATSSLECYHSLTHRKGAAMRQFAIQFLAAFFVTASLFWLAGCYEDLGGTQTQTQTPPQAPTQQSGPVQQGPLTGYGSPAAGSALGGAKRSAENLADRVQDSSQRIADGEGWND